LRITTRTSIISNYNSLSADVKTLVGEIRDNTTAYANTTLLDTLTVLNGGTAPSYAISSLSDYGNYIPWIIVSVASMIAVGGFFFLRSKKHARA
jgi:hypothetical protein